MNVIHTSNCVKLHFHSLSCTPLWPFQHARRSRWLGWWTAKAWSSLFSVLGRPVYLPFSRVAAATLFNEEMRQEVAGSFVLLVFFATLARAGGAFTVSIECPEEASRKRLHVDKNERLQPFLRHIRCVPGSESLETINSSAECLEQIHL